MGIKGEQTRRKLVKTARDLFRLQGFSHTSIDDIARAAQVNRGNLYFYFSSKEELAAAALDYALEREFVFLDRAMGAETDPLKRLDLMIAAIVDYSVRTGCAGGCFFGTLAQELGDTHRDLALKANRFFARWKALIVSLLEQGKEQGRLRPETDGEALAGLIVSSLEGALLICKASKDPALLTQTQATLAALVASQQTKPKAGVKRARRPAKTAQEG